LFDDSPDEIYSLNIVPDEDQRTFPTKDVFVQAACHIGRGENIDCIGSKIDIVKERTNFQPVIEDNVIRGMAVYIDAYGNVTTNITRSLIKLAGKGRRFSIVFRRSDYNINELQDNYSEVPEGEKLALFSTNDHLEIAINKGNACKLFGIKLSDTIRIEFIN
jgi:S-adenosylmethionine hydrolase